MDYLALAGGLVLGKEDPGNVSEGFEQLLEVVLLGTLTQVAHPENIERSQIRVGIKNLTKKPTQKNPPKKTH
jgi:hypothetical protein